VRALDPLAPRLRALLASVAGRLETRDKLAHPGHQHLDPFRGIEASAPVEAHVTEIRLPDGRGTPLDEVQRISTNRTRWFAYSGRRSIDPSLVSLRKRAVEILRIVSSSSKM
jgi:hypothetical protein